MKDALRLLVYFGAVIVAGALLAPVLFWTAQILAADGIFPGLTKYGFESFFHRALLIAALVFLWPLLQSLGVRKWSDLALEPNPRWGRDAIGGFLIASIPLLFCGAILIAAHIFRVRITMNAAAMAKIIAASIAVPVIEEIFFRGLILGILLRSGWRYLAVGLTSAIYSIIHFLKAPESDSTVVTWSTGFSSIGHAFSQFADPLLLFSGFITLFLIGWILADSRLLTRSLWLPIGLHSGWIFASQSFSKVAHRQMIVLPWIGKNLLIGIVPLAVAAASWMLVRLWLKRNAQT